VPNRGRVRTSGVRRILPRRCLPIAMARPSVWMDVSCFNSKSASARNCATSAPQGTRAYTKELERRRRSLKTLRNKSGEMLDDRGKLRHNQTRRGVKVHLCSQCRTARRTACRTACMLSVAVMLLRRQARRVLGAGLLRQPPHRNGRTWLRACFAAMTNHRGDALDGQQDRQQPDDDKLAPGLHEVRASNRAQFRHIFHFTRSASAFHRGRRHTVDARQRNRHGANARLERPDSFQCA